MAHELKVEDTVVAIASPPGQGAVAILRVSGPEAIPIAKRIFRSKSGEVKWRPRALLLGNIVNSDDEIIDQVFDGRIIESLDHEALIRNVGGKV